MDANIIQSFEDETGKKAVRGGVYTKKFQNWNKKKVKDRLLDRIVFDDSLIFNRSTRRFVEKSKFYKKNGGLRATFNNEDNIISGDTILQPKVYVKNIFQPQIKKALKSNKGLQRIKIDMMSINDNIEYILRNLKVKGEKRYYIEAQGRTWSLNSNTIKKLREILQPGFVESVEFVSGMELLTAIQSIPKPTLVIRNIKKKGVIGGAFFKYTHRTDLDLSRYGIYKEIKAENYEVNCLCKSFEVAGLDITGIKTLVRNQEIPQRKLKEVANSLGVYITIRKPEDTQLRKYGNPEHTRLDLGLIDKHYFLIEKTIYNSYCIKNWEEVKDKKDWNRIYQKEGNKFKRKDRFIDSYTAIRLLLENTKLLSPITLCDELYKTTEYKKIDQDIFGSLDYNQNIQGYNWKTKEFEEGGLKKNEYRKPRKEELLGTYYFDFETSTKRKDGVDTTHKPYCVYSDQHRNGFFGDECGKYFLQDLVNRHGMFVEDLYELEDNGTMEWDLPFVRLIAHNAGYDFKFIMKYLSRVNSIEKGTGLMTASARFYAFGKVINLQIRDSLKMINMPLRKFAPCFDLEIKKEIMPYDLYSEENIVKKYIEIEECLSWVAEKEREEYLDNCEKWGCIEKDKIDILRYAGEYCYMDCVVLKQGYEIFAELVDKAIGEKITDYISLASMAHNYLIREKCYDKVLSLSGVPRAFIQKCVVGGRTMCCENKKDLQLTDKLIDDFDAVSLYPSAMNRMKGFLKGKPKVITSKEHFEWCLDHASGFFVCVKVKKIKEKRKFPCVSLMGEGVRNFTNDLEGYVVYLDKIGLEDFVKYQGGKYQFINGYYYDEGHNNKINNVMEHLFKQRLKYKKIGNPIQMVFKELMNSSYGKSYLKPIDSDSYYIKEEDYWDYMDRNYNYVKESVLMPNGMYKIDVVKSIDDHFNNVHIGVEILSMSKRIMYEVMYLAEDLNLSMYYTDTDSIHIDTESIPILEREFNKKYGRELIGKQMGQFHSDFDMDSSLGKVEEVHAVESVFLGKKCYIDKLEGTSVDTGEKVYDYHIRMKGVPEKSIVYKAKQDYGGDLIALYKDLYHGKKVEFDLLANGQIKFELNNDGSICNRKDFRRTLSF